MTVAKQELFKRVEKIYEQSESLRHYVALIKSMDNTHLEDGCLCDVVNYF